MAFTAGVGPVEQSETGGGQAPATLNGTTAGRSLIFCVRWYHATITLTSVTISGESNGTLLTQRDSSVLSVSSHIVWGYLQNNTGGGDKTITANWSATLGGNGAIWVKEYDGGDITALIDGDSTGADSASSQTAQSSITAGAANDLVLSVVECTTVADTGWTPNSGYTAIDIANIVGYEKIAEDLDAGAAGAKTPGFDLGSAGPWACAAAAFKVVSSGSSAALGGSSSTSAQTTGVPSITIQL